jgi:hypothetical protein
MKIASALLFIAPVLYCGELPQGWLLDIKLNSTSGNGVNTVVFSNGGGKFRATIGTTSAEIWCTDDQLHFANNQSVVGNVLPFSYIDPANPLNGAPVGYPGAYLQDVRYETLTSAAGATGNWASSIAGMAIPGSNAAVLGAEGDTALFRYKAAAWLITQYDTAYLGTNAENTHNLRIQDSMWELMDIDPNAVHATVEGATDWYVQAIKYVSNNWADPQWNEWAVVSSWLPNTSGGPGPLNGPNDPQRQTFLTRISPTPEPSSWILFMTVAGVLGYRMKKRIGTASSAPRS